MKKEVLMIFLKRCVLFTLVFLLIDFVFGSIAVKLYFSQESGKFARLTYSIKKDTSEVLIFGSSHANRHYIPEIISKGLNESTYNVGVQGQKLLFQTTLLKLILNRHKPSTIILNIDKDWLFESNEAYDRLNDFNPYFWEYRSDLFPVLSLKSSFVYPKMFFKSYRTNSTIVHIVKYFISPQKDYNGYRPLQGTISVDRMNKLLKTSSKYNVNKGVFDVNFINALHEFINLSKRNGIDLVFVLSPSLVADRYGDNESFKLIADIASESGVSIIDFEKNNQFSRQNHLFNDLSHLNDLGANLFSSLLVDELRSIKLEGRAL